ncbi:MAG: DUF4956 domain-containing protein [Bacilli bacterium]|nr:DUF4956 domain-containing protein [Bacilli bacterium]
MLNSIFSDATSSVDLVSILLCSLCSIILGIVIALTHKATSKYNKHFLTTLAVLPLLVQVVIIMVNGNLGTSVAIVGAFSLVRFRSLPGNSKEILSVFFAMSIGLITGMGHIVFAIITTVLGCIMLLLFHKIPIFEIKKQERILRILVPENLDYTSMFDDIFETYTKKVDLEKVKTVNMGSLFDLTYRITLNKDINEKEFIDELRVKNGNLKIILSHPLEESEL